MVPVLDRPFLEYQFAWLKKTGFNRFLLLVGHLSDQIRNYFGDGKERGLSIRYSCESSPMGTAGALKLAEPLIEESFLLLNGDSLLPVDYHLLIHRFKRIGCEAMVAAYDNREKIAPNNLSLSRDRGWATRYRKTDSVGMTHMDAGVYVFQKRVLGRIPPNRPYSFENELLPELAQEGVLAAYTTDIKCYDIGTPERLEVFEQAVASNLIRLKGVEP